MNELSSMTLQGFQNSRGIRLEDQIILINNPGFFAGFSPLISSFGSANHPSRANRAITKAVNQFRVRFQGLPLDNDRLFLGYFDRSLDSPNDFVHAIFKKIHRAPDRRFTLIVGKGDYELGEEIVECMPRNLVSLIGNNLNCDHPRLRYLPMGRDFRNQELLSDLTPGSKKSMLCYCNFSVSTHSLRESVYASLKSKSFITFQHMGEFLSYPISRHDFMKNLREAKFCICPRGNAIDTFRLWDCLYCGTVPIVVREASFHDLLDDLPILFLDDYQEFSSLTTEYLENVYETFLFKKFNYKKLTKHYWLDFSVDSQ